VFFERLIDTGRGVRARLPVIGRPGEPRWRTIGARNVSTSGCARRGTDRILSSPGSRGRHRLVPLTLRNRLKKALASRDDRRHQALRAGCTASSMTISPDLAEAGVRCRAEFSEAGVARSSNGGVEFSACGTRRPTSAESCRDEEHDANLRSDSPGIGPSKPVLPCWSAGLHGRNPEGTSLHFFASAGLDHEPAQPSPGSCHCFGWFSFRSGRDLHLQEVRPCVGAVESAGVSLALSRDWAVGVR